MPCEGCKVQFTVFRRKRICTDCRRFFCGNCLTSKRRSSSSVVLCERCAIFAKRPLQKVDLAQLKPKDLIFFLQSKHISTTGCVERDELVLLVLNHVNGASSPPHSISGGSNFSGASQSEETNTSFDNIKQTCQNFFNSISDRVELNFESKPKNHSQQSYPSSETSSHISDQPRVSAKEIPAYPNMQKTNSPTTKNSPNINNAFVINSNNNTSPSPTAASTPTASSSNNSSQVSSPVISIDSVFTHTTSSHSRLSRNEVPNDAMEDDSIRNNVACKKSKVTSEKSIESHGNGNTSGCECSDDEIIRIFNSRRASIAQACNSVVDYSESNQIPRTTLSPSSVDSQKAGPSGTSVSLEANATADSIQNKSSHSLKIESIDEDSGSSFEELGATGGKPTDEWQFINEAEKNDLKTTKPELQDGVEESDTLTVALVENRRQCPFLVSRPKRVTRRRSDGYLSRRQYDDNFQISRPVFALNRNESLDEEQELYLDLRPDADNETAVNDVLDQTEFSGASTSFVPRNGCKRCGKTKSNMKRHVKNLQRHLEESQMSEEDIKRELKEFLSYLKNRTQSLDTSDSEAVDTNRDIDYQPQSSPPLDFYDVNDGVRVYSKCQNNSRFISLENFDSLDDLDSLTVKQLKEVLMVNRVDYKGCCEKQELLDRVVRLWKNLKSSPAIEKLQTDELCKICMDAPIECVILECGHMATCTGCGKVLSECPICRQYIVRVVRFFRA